MTPVPQTMKRWHLYGAGWENLGRDGQSETVPIPAYGPNELLVRIDACGLCFSDTKVIAQGGSHPRLTGRDLAQEPVTLGHEVACTVVGVGANRAERYRVGQRFTVQADVFYQGRGMAYGYVIAGGLSQYGVIPEAILDGDEGCYLLPVQPQTGYVASALTEPWACVVSAYNQAHREFIKENGLLLVILNTADDADWVHIPIHNHVGPKHVIVSCDMPVEGEVWQSRITTQVGMVSDYKALKQQYTESVGFDDILVVGEVAPEVIEQATASLADHGVMYILRGTLVPRKLSLDVGRIHYNWHHYLGNSLANAPFEHRTKGCFDGYIEPRTAELLPGGVCWIVGAGGPMGQMHVQRALGLSHPPRRIVATDIDHARLQSVSDRFGVMARERGIGLIALNPSDFDADAFAARLREAGTGGERSGFDDIVIMAPFASAIEHAADFLADGGWLNIFAGVARGTMAKIDVNRIIRDRCRIVGSTGSSLSDMRETLARVESGELDTNASLAAIGGMDAAAEGLRAVKEGWFAGKTLIFPQIPDLPLMSLTELQDTLPNVYALLQDGQFWTNEAEEELLRLNGASSQ
jgi:L-sorbose 1-phosphate reductase